MPNVTYGIRTESLCARIRFKLRMNPPRVFGGVGCRFLCNGDNLPVEGDKIGGLPGFGHVGFGKSTLFEVTRVDEKGYGVRYGDQTIREPLVFVKPVRDILNEPRDLFTRNP